MDQRYNLDNLEASFKQWLLAGIEKTRNDAKKEVKLPAMAENKTLTPISVKNYLSDLRHFLGWLTFYLKSHFPNKQISINLNLSQFISSYLTIETVEAYKTYQVENSLPIKTINRRLSTLRKFFSFCISQGWMKENPAKRVSNIASSHLSVTPAKAGIHNKWIPPQGRDKEILYQFQQALQKENLDQSTIKSYLEDVREFLKYTNQHEWEHE